MVRRSLAQLAVAVVVAAACVQPGAAPAGQQQTATAAATAQPPKEVLIGAVYPLTGALAPTGVDLKNGIELAVELINSGRPDIDLPLLKDGGGLKNLGGAKLKLVFADSAGDPAKGQAETERLITSEKVAVMTGAFQSAVTATASQAAERLQVPFVNAESSSPTLVARDFKWFFRSTPDDSMFAENFFQFLDDAATRFPGKVAKKVVILHTDDLFGSDVNKFVRQFAEKYKYEVVSSVAYKLTAPDLTSEIQRLKASGAPILIEASYLADATLAIRTMKQQDVNFQAVLAMDAGFVDTKFIPNVGKDAEFMLTREVWAKDLGTRKPIVKQVNDIFRAKYGTDMTGSSARAFTGIFVIADAINRARSIDAVKIQEALKQTNIPASQIVMPWEGIQFDARGQNTKGRGIMVQIQGGEYVTVWPLELASKPLIWPMPEWTKR